MKPFLGALIIILSLFSQERASAGVVCAAAHLQSETVTAQNYKELAMDFEKSFARTGSRYDSFGPWLAYTMNGYRSINEYLRTTKPRFTAPIEKPKEGSSFEDRIPSYAYTLEKLFDRGLVLGRNETLYRGAAIAPLRIPKAGDIMTDEAFLSTSLSKEKGLSFAKMNQSWAEDRSVKKVLFVITNLSERKVILGNDKEIEVILNRNTPIHVVNVVESADLAIVYATLK